MEAALVLLVIAGVIGFVFWRSKAERPGGSAGGRKYDGGPKRPS